MYRYEAPKKTHYDLHPFCSDILSICVVRILDNTQLTKTDQFVWLLHGRNTFKPGWLVSWPILYMSTAAPSQSHFSIPIIEPNSQVRLLVENLAP